jgi:hypothetical protein
MMGIPTARTPSKRLRDAIRVGILMSARVKWKYGALDWGMGHLSSSSFKYLNVLQRLNAQDGSGVHMGCLSDASTGIKVLPLS